MSVGREQRFTPSHPCPICGGHDRAPRGKGQRCFGFLSEDGIWAHCTREEYSGGLERKGNSGTYAHRLVGDCLCGVRHEPTSPSSERRSAAPREVRTIEATYDYLGSDGKLKFQVVRYSSKGFSQRRPDGSDGWVWNLEGVELVLYRLPELLASDPKETVYVVEGEKDADRLASRGLLATTSPHGAKKWRDEYTAALAGRRVVVIPDNDKAGGEHALRVVAELRAVAESTKLVELPGLSEGGDISDWLDAGGTLEELERLVRETPKWNPEAGAEPSVGRLVAEVEPERLSWLWQERIPLGKLTLIDGDPGTGKSALTTDLAARVSVGRVFPDGTTCGAAGVVLLSAEDGLADTIRPRLEAAGADLNRILSLVMVQDGNSERLLSIPEDISIIRQAIERVEAQLVVVDPLMAFLSGGVNSYKDQDVRKALAPLAKLAEQTEAAIVVVRHLNKAAGGNPLYRGGGSIGIIGQARSALLVAKHPEDDRRRVLAPLKANLSARAPSLAFVLTHSAIGAVRVEWRGETALDANALLAAPVNDEERQELNALRDAAVDLLEGTNNDVQGEIETKLFEGNGGRWEGTATQLHDLFAKRDVAALPDRPDELTKRLKKIARTSEDFTVSNRWRRKERVLVLQLLQHQEPKCLNGVDGVGGVGSVGATASATGFEGNAGDDFHEFTDHSSSTASAVGA